MHFVLHTRSGRLFASSTDDEKPRSDSRVKVAMEKRMYPVSFMPPGPTRINFSMIKIFKAYTCMPKLE